MGSQSQYHPQSHPLQPPRSSQTQASLAAPDCPAGFPHRPRLLAPSIHSHFSGKGTSVSHLHPRLQNRANCSPTTPSWLLHHQAPPHLPLYREFGPSPTSVLLTLQPCPYGALTRAVPSAQNALPCRPALAAAPMDPSGLGLMPGQGERLMLACPCRVSPLVLGRSTPAQASCTAHGGLLLCMFAVKSTSAGPFCLVHAAHTRPNPEAQ